MKKQAGIFDPRLLTISILLILMLAGCAQSPGACRAFPSADLSGVASFAKDDQLMFQFPLDDASPDASPFFTNFCESSDGPESARKYHAAEDFFRPAGTPVYAMADGNISFSGPMDGYGGLIIIDHPQANLYSLYGHLSPSRWWRETGMVEKGELIAYLGDSDENGGSSEHPLKPHLHLGVRAGQRADYPSTGEWRWQAGWISLCPQDIGWLQPSVIITSQEIPAGGFPEPSSGFVAKWGVELLFVGFYLVGGVCMLVFAIKKNKPFILVITGGAMIAAGWIFYSKGTRMSYALFAMAILFLVIGIYRLIRRSTNGSPTQA
jgi:hypothetical protein